MRIFSAAIASACLGLVEALRGSAHEKYHSLNANATNVNQCISILAVAGSPYISDQDNSTEASNDEEAFLCELSDGYLAPMHGTSKQFERLRSLLNSGVLVSAESTIEITKAGNIVVKKRSSKSSSRWSRRLQTKGEYNGTYEGEKKVLIVRISDVNGLHHPDSPAMMSGKIFRTDTLTIASHFDACSFGKLKLSYKYPVDISEHLSAPGVIDVGIPISLHDNAIGRGDIRDAAITSLEEKLGMAMPGPFDHVMFVLEGCYGDDCGWSAFAFINSWFSIFKGDYYKNLVVSMHEIGHNLNLAHSGSDRGFYADHTCLMGNPRAVDGAGAMCFNPAKNFQLANAGNAWYSDKPTDTQVWNSGTTGGTQWSGRVVGIADYNNNAGAYTVVLKVESGSPEDLFIGFNRAAGPNRGVVDSIDKVVVVQAGSDGLGYSQSFLKVALDQGESFSFSDWRGSGLDLVIAVKEIQVDLIPAYASILITFGEVPSQLPTHHPSQYHYCGDLVCDSDENDSICPTDCAQIEFTTTYEFDSGASGNMFTLKAVRDVKISSLSIDAMKRGIGAVKVYTRKGSYIGFEQDINGWELIYDNPSVTHLRRGEQTQLGKLGREILIARGSVQSFYVTSTNGLVYKTGIEETTMFSSDNALIAYEGIGMLNEFGTCIAPRIWNGVVVYDIIGSPTSFQWCGNFACDPNESVLTCPSDCTAKTLKTTFEFDSGSNGNMFIVKAIRNISIYALDINAMSPGSSAVKVLIRQGSFKGYESSSTGWKVVYDRPRMELNDRGHATKLGDLDEVVYISSGQIVSFYVWAENKLVYTKGSSSSLLQVSLELQPYTSDGFLTVHEGIGIKDYFGPFIDSRVWNGVIYYES